jgi:M6 family metalloprotease-like protein
MKPLNPVASSLPSAFLAGIAILFVASVSSWALEPPTKAQIEQYRRDGTLPARIEAARALGNQKVSPARVADLQRRVAALQGKGGPSNTPPPAWRGMPTKGTVKLFALLIAFNDTPFHTDAAAVQNSLFGDGNSADFPMESLRNFYRRASYDQLEITGATLGWYTAPYPRRNVPQTTAGREGLIKEALNAMDAQGHDFSQYDNDGDGAIDYFLVIWTGADTGWANFWWGYQTGFNDGSYRLDGNRLGAYSWQWESRPYGGTFSPEVTIHETGHALGLPDYYDYDDAVGPMGGVGGLDQMDANWGDHNCFSKFLLDWITPTFCGEPGAHAATLQPSETTQDVLLLMPGVQDGEIFGEFFMVQNRRRTHNDQTFPNDGLLVWHVDARLNNPGYDFLYDNSYTEHKLLRLMEADGLEEIEWNSWADAGDYYTAGTSIGPATHPNSTRYMATQTGVEVGNISGGESMTFTASCAFAGPYMGFQRLSLEDRCNFGSGEGNGFADPGEDLDLSPMVRNDGTQAATSVTATLTTTASGATITAPTVLYGAIEPGASGLPVSPFGVTLSPTLPCGAQIPFLLHAACAQNPSGWDMGFTLTVGRTAPLSDNFENWPLGSGWVVVDDTDSGMPWGSGLGYGCRTNRTGGTGDFASADADCAYNFDGITTTLMTPSFDLSGVTTARLQFKTYFDDYYGTTVGTVEASGDGGSAWTVLRQYQSGDDLPVVGEQNLDLAPFLGSSDVRARFRYVTGAWEVYWQLDDLAVLTNCVAKACVSPCSGTQRVIQSVKYNAPAKTLKVYGTGLVAGDVVTINGQPTTTKLKKGALVASKVPKIAKGATAEVRVSAPDAGCSSEPFFYTRP